MEIGLFFGSFNPIHNGHLISASFILNETSIKKIWFIVSPQNPFKQTKTMLNEYDRLHLVRLAVYDDTRMKAMDIEFKLPKPSYTTNTLAYLEDKFPQHKFTIIMGSDSFQNIKKWKNFEASIKKYPICIYRREGFEITNTYGANINVLKSPIIEISATQIREYIKLGKSVRYLVPENVREEIETRRLYKKSSQKK